MFFTACGDKVCDMYQMCFNQQCVCGDACTLDYLPVCGKSKMTGVIRVFSNLCGLKKYSCQNAEMYLPLPEDMCDATGSFICDITVELR